MEATLRSRRPILTRVSSPSFQRARLQNASSSQRLRGRMIINDTCGDSRRWIQAWGREGDYLLANPSASMLTPTVFPE